MEINNEKLVNLVTLAGESAVAYYATMYIETRKRQRESARERKQVVRRAVEFAKEHGFTE